MPTPAIKTDDTAILALHEAGKSTRAIADILGNCKKTTIAKRLKHLTPRKTTQIFRELRADVLSEMQRKFLMRMDAADPKNARDYMTAFGIAYDKERLERNLSNVNVATQVGLTPALQEAVDRICGRDTENAKVDQNPSPGADQVA